MAYLHQECKGGNSSITQISHNWWNKEEFLNLVFRVLKAYESN